LVLASAHVEVLLAAVAVVAEVEDLVVGQGSHGPFGVGLLRDMHPQRGAALAGVAEVLLDGVGVIGDGPGDPLGEAAFGLEPLPAVQDLLAGVDPQVTLGEPGVGQGCLGLLGLVGVLEDGDQEALGVEDQRPFTRRRSWSDIPVGQTTSWSSMTVAFR
jgi:hypothetical protein